MSLLSVWENRLSDNKRGDFNGDMLAPPYLRLSVCPPTNYPQSSTCLDNIWIASFDIAQQLECGVIETPEISDHYTMILTRPYSKTRWTADRSNSDLSMKAVFLVLKTLIKLLALHMKLGVICLSRMTQRVLLERSENSLQSLRSQLSHSSKTIAEPHI